MIYTDYICSEYFASIFLNFNTNNKHGCKYNCSFCQWKKFNKKLNPTIQDLENFFKQFPNIKKVSISGGGDPLFNYNENRTYLLDLIQFLHYQKVKVELITRDIDCLTKNIDDFKLIDKITISVQSENKNILDKILQLRDAGYIIRIIKVLSKMDLDYSTNSLLHFIQFYNHDKICIVLREDYSDRFSDLELAELKIYLKKIGFSEYQTNIIRCDTKNNIFQTVVLNNIITTIADVDNMLLNKDITGTQLYKLID